MHPSARTPWPRLVVLGLILSVLVTVIVLAFSWPSITSEPKDIPVAIVGSAQQVDAIEEGIEANAEGLLVFTEVGDRDAAVTAIEKRDVYGAIVIGQEPEVLTASAGSPVVSQLHNQLAATLQAQLNQAAAAQAAAAGVQAPQLTVTVTDIVPLADTDPRGAGLTTAFFPLVMGGMIGGIALTFAVAGAWRRVVGVVIYATVAGLAVTAVLQLWLGVLQGTYLQNAAGFGLALLAIAAPIVGLAALVGRAGIALGPVVFLLFANPISGGASPLQFLPEPWGAVGQWFPPGAGATLIRDLSYFPSADTAFPWLVLASWSIAGLLLGIAGHFRGERARLVLDEEPVDEVVEVVPASR